MIQKAGPPQALLFEQKKPRLLPAGFCNSYNCLFIKYTLPPGYPEYYFNLANIHWMTPGLTVCAKKATGCRSPDAKSCPG